MKPTLKRAFEEAMALIDESDMNGLRGRRGPVKVEVEMGAKGMCPDCEAGDCAEHLSEEDAAGMASMYGED